MANNVLLYPDIHLTDPAPAKIALLFWDRVYRIVPTSVEPRDHKQIEEIRSASKTIVSLDPRPYTKATYQSFKRKLPRWAERAIALNAPVRQKEALGRLHPDKVYDALLDQIRRQGLLDQTDDGWMVGPRELVEQYMVYLASEMARRNNMKMITTSREAWTSQGFFRMDGAWARRGLNRATGEMAVLLLKDYIPGNIRLIPPRKLLDWRDDHRDLRRRLSGQLNEWAAELAAIEDPEILEESILAKRDEIDTTIRRFKTEARALKVEGFVGTKAVLTPLAASIVGQFMDLGQILNATLLAAGLTIGTLWSLSSTRKNLAKLAASMPISYLVSLETLSEYEDVWEYAGSLYRGIEQFVED